VSVRARPPLDVTTPRGVGQLLRLTFRLFFRHPLLFMSASLLVVAPIAIATEALWSGQLRDAGPASGGVVGWIGVTLLTWIALPSLITALHAVIVRDMGEGRVPRVGRALREAGPRLPAVFAAVALYCVSVAGGLVLLIAPGIWLAISRYFGAQVVVLEGLGALAALRRSSDLVRGRWADVFGALLMSWIVFGACGAIPGLIVQEIDATVPFLIAYILVEASFLSLAALFGTLLFFDTRSYEE
jgi:hypothetical protein